MRGSRSQLMLVRIRHYEWNARYSLLCLCSEGHEQGFSRDFGVSTDWPVMHMGRCVSPHPMSNVCRCAVRYPVGRRQNVLIGVSSTRVARQESPAIAH